MKHYLDGFDYVATMLNYDCRNTPGRGNHFLVVLELETALEKTEVQENLPCWNPFCRFFPAGCAVIACMPLLTGCRESRAGYGLLQGMNLVPANTALDGALEVMLLNQGPRHFLVFKFSHLLFDGRGAELLIEAVRSGDVSMLRGEPVSPLRNSMSGDASSAAGVRCRGK